MRKRRFSVKILLLVVLVFGVVFAGTFVGVQAVTHTGIFRIPGVVYYDESLSADELAVLERIFTEEVDLDKDVHVSARWELVRPELGEGEWLTEVLVPVTDFYSVETNVDLSREKFAFNGVEILLAGPESLPDGSENVSTNLENTSTSFEEILQGSQAGVKFLAIDSLKHTDKLLKLNGCYYLDEFTCGGVYRVVSVESELYEEEVAPLIGDVLEREFPSSETVLTFAQTGVTALSRGMNAKLNQVGDATYFAAKIGDYLSSFDLTHTSNESSFTDFATARNICSDKRFISTLTAIGLDIVELTGNHNQDCGDQAALETIDTYIANGIKTVGGGKTAAEAAVPLEIEAKGSSVTMLAFNQSTGGATYDNTPGANQYYEEVAAAQIKEAKARGDTVIVDVQYYECNAYASEYEDPICDYANSAAGDQIGLFRHLIDLGADVVVGTAAHQPQAYELYGDGVIYYGLGNLFFDQVWWPGTTRSLILAHYFYKDKLVQTKIVPTVYDNNMQTELMNEETAKWFLGRLVSARP